MRLSTLFFSLGFAVGFGLGNFIVFHLKYEESAFVCRRRSDFFQSGYLVLFLLEGGKTAPQHCEWDGLAA